MAALADLCRFIPTLGGTTDFVYSSTVGGCQSPTAANVQNGVPYKLSAVSNDLTQFEIFEGIYNSGTGTFPRTTVLFNSSQTGTRTPGQSGAGTKINFTTVPQVAIVGLAEDLISVEVANGFTTAQQRQARNNIGVGPNSTVSANQIFAGPTTGAAADPTFRAPVGADSAMVLLGTATASNSASISFTGLSGASYSELILYIDALIPVNNAAGIQAQISTGSGFLAGTNYSYEVFSHTSSVSALNGASSAANFVINNGVGAGNGVNQTFSFRIEFYGADNVAPLKRANWQGSALSSGATFNNLSGGGQITTNSAIIDGVQISLTNGNISSGTFRLYGLRNA